MHSPRPYGRFADDIELSDEDNRVIESMARNLTNFKALSGLDMLKRVRDLPSGRQAVAIDAGGTFRVLVFDQSQPESFLYEGLAQSNVPMLFSGVIDRYMVKKEGDEGVTIKLTEQARRRLSGYGETDKPKEKVELQRFTIEYHRDFEHFIPPITGIYTFTQYHRHRPTWYSGAMAEVMQVVGGYGKQKLAELPEDELERATMSIPALYMRKIEEELINVRLPGYTGFPDSEGQFRCDFKHSKCHGVSFDEGGQPWLIQVSQNGVYAMPLPLIPATTTKAFRDYMEGVDDQEIIKLLDRFGGMPSGETFPDEGHDFEAWRRAGVIIKVCDTADFYDHRAYYTAGGWSFNTQGTEGFNTCWDYDESGLIQSFAYKMKLTLGAAKNAGRIPLEWDLSTDAAERADQMRRLDAYLSKLFRQLDGNDPRDLAIKYKLRRHTVEEILSKTGEGVDYWDGLEMEPIATHSGSVTQTARGPVYWGLWMYPQSQGRLKFPALSGEGCESFIFVSPDYRGPAVRCDTIMFGCYVGDQLQVVKYFIDEREFHRETQSNFVSPMYVGSWQKTSTSGSSGLVGYFYTSAWDDRVEVADSTTTTKITGTDLGYSNPRWQTPGLLSMWGTLSRSRHYKHLTRTETVRGHGIDVAVCVPVFARDAIMYAFKEGADSRSESEETSQGAVADPISYSFWTYDSIFHYLGQWGRSPPGVTMKNGTPVYLDRMNVGSDPSGFASSGNWFGFSGTPVDVTGTVGKYTQRGSAHNANGVVIGGEAPRIQPYSWSRSYGEESSGDIRVSIEGAGNARFSHEMPSEFYFDFSPAPNVSPPLYFYRDVARITIGESQYCSVYEKKSSGLRHSWGHSRLADNKTAHHFIGVINE